jgi:hypothetical protein
MASSVSKRTRPSLNDRLRKARRLALTWFERQLRKDIPPPNDEQDDWQFVHERLYGAGHFDERVELLEDALRRAAADGVRIGAVIAILRRARLALLLHSHAGAHLDWSRPVALRVRQIQRHLDTAADSLIALYRDLDPDNLPHTAASCETTARRIREALTDDPLFRHYRDIRVRRERAGRQPQPWVKKARKQLARIGVRPDVRENLLEAVGLIRYRRHTAR